MIPAPTPQAAVEPEPLLLDVKSVCKLLNVCRNSLHSASQTGTFAPLPIKAFGRKLLYSRAEILSWLEKGAPPRRVWQAQKGAR